MTDPTDAEIEAMAERLWDTFRLAAGDPGFADFSWSEVLAEVREDVLAYTFRAMARAALRTEPGGDEVRG